MILWDPANSGKKPVARLHGHQKAVNHVAFSPDGTLIASTGWDNHTRIWNARYVKNWISPTSSLSPAAYSDAGTDLLFASSLDVSFLFPAVLVADYPLTLPPDVAPVFQCAFSADSRLLVTASRDTTLKVWNVRGGKLARDLPGHEDEVYTVDWAPSANSVCSGGKDKAVRLWRN